MAEGRQVILFVEDEYLLRITTADELRDAGYEVIEAGHAAEALRILEAPSQKVHILLTDVQMPGEMNGLGLAAWAREHRPDVGIAIWSGADWALRVARALTEPTLVFSKPIGGDELARSFQVNLPPVEDERQQSAQ
jgi:DNA-binding NtrC family response regulator